MRRSDCYHVHLGALRLSLALPIPCLLRCVRGVPVGLATRLKLPGSARALGRPVPQSGKVTRRPVALPSSRVPPLPACPALRPRWCPGHWPSRTQGCRLLATGNRRLSPPYHLEGSPRVHNDTPFGAPSRGRPAHALQLRPPIAGRARGVHYRPAGSALIGWDLHRTGSHPLGSNNHLHGLSPNAKVSGFP
jgi:hypothetical protein